MPDKFTQMTPELYRYVVEHSGPDELLARLAAETEREAGDLAVMQIAPEQGALMTLLARAIGARRAIELGTFTGYGAICIARGLSEEGLLVTCDVSEEWTRIAQRYWQEAGLAERIELRLGPAAETLAAIDAAEPFDFAFIDADKQSYPLYYEECLRLLRPGGLIVLDNVFRGGSIVDASDGDERLDATRAVNDRIASDERVISAMIGVSDGITLALKR